MVLIDAIHINNGGGKVLLDYLIQKLEQTDRKIFYLFDSRIEQGFSYNIKPTNHFQFMQPSLFQRYKFCKKYKDSFSKIFIFGNIPPLTKMKGVVYSYFHNSIYLSVPQDFSFLEKLKYILKVGIIKQTSKNVDYWLVQSQTLKDQFIHKFAQSEKVKILPFFPSLSSENEFVREENTLFYVSNAQANKNHKRLIEAFCNAYDKLQKGKLMVTVNENFPEIISLIENVQKKGYPIVNIGFVDRETLVKFYKQSEYVVFPSLAESFGLGLIEGISMGCKVIGADLPYTYAVCEPSLIFNPLDVLSIENTLISAMNEPQKQSISKVKDEIDELINLLA